MIVRLRWAEKSPICITRFRERVAWYIGGQPAKFWRAVSLRFTAFVSLILLSGGTFAAADGSVPGHLVATGGDAPIVIAHRGASGLLPEHTLAAYRLALQQGADFIEPDVVATLDGVLIARHENALAVVALASDGTIERDGQGAARLVEQTTNVAEHAEFSNRLVVKVIDGRKLGGWFSEDFTLAEIRTLRARERIPELRGRVHDDRYGIATLAEVLALVEDFRSTSSRAAGVYIETKHPTYFAVEGRRLDGARINLDLGSLLLKTLVEAGFTDPARVYIQSFEIANLMALRATMAQFDVSFPLIQLFGDIFNTRYRARPYDLAYNASQDADLTAIYGALAAVLPGGITQSTSYAELASSAVFAFMAANYASGIGPPKHNVLLTRRVARGQESVVQLTGEVGAVVALARDHGLLIHPYTLRAEAPFLVAQGGRLLSVVEEAQLLLCAGVDGFFIDQPAAGRRAVAAFTTSYEQQNCAAR